MDDSLLQSPYKTLDIPEDASHAVIRKTFRKLVLSCHPDRVQDESTKKQKIEQFHQVVQAYEILSDDSRRHRYDKRLNLQKLRLRATEPLPLPKSPYAPKIEIQGDAFDETGKAAGSQHVPLDSSTSLNERMDDPWNDLSPRSSLTPYSLSYPLNHASHHPQKQHSSEYGYTPGYQTLQPPPLYLRYLSTGKFINRTSSHGSSDSGYATKASSIASTSYQRYPIQSSDPSPQLSQQNAIHSYGNQRSHDTEALRIASTSSSIHKERKLR